MSRAETKIRNLVRRMVVTATDIARWTLRGHEDESGAEQLSAPIYPGIGLHARPPEGAEAEAVVVHIDANPNRPVIVAVRDPAAESFVASVGLEPGETLVHNGTYILKLTADGVLVGMPNGDFSAVALDNHTHAAPAITGQASYADPDARTGPPDRVSEHVKVT